jgi:hypothetical protein
MAISAWGIRNSLDGMKLTSTNRYLRDPNVRETMVMRSVATSSAIEGIRTPFGRQPRKAKSHKNIATGKR